MVLAPTNPIEAWWPKWIGARAPAGVSAPCWWLVRRIYLEEMGIDLPEEGAFAARERWARLIGRGLRGGEWLRLPGPQDLAVALVRLPGGWHVGVVAAGEPAMLISTVARAAAAQRLARYLEAGAVRGFYWYRPRASGRGPGRASRSTSTRSSGS